jgi:hypothetical protein
MREAPNNPAGNRIPAGTNEKALVASIEHSGYPLQGIVAAKLLDRFGVTEEWGYRDRDTGEHRTLDIYAYRKLRENSVAETSRLLLIECKRSNSAFVFFRSVVDRPLADFPAVVGLLRDYVEVSEPQRRRTHFVSIGEVLGLKDVNSVKFDPPLCSAFVKGEPKGDKVTLTGTSRSIASSFHLQRAWISRAIGLPRSRHGRACRPLPFAWLSSTLRWSLRKAQVRRPIRSCVHGFECSDKRLRRRTR